MKRDIDYSKLTSDDFVWEKNMARPVMYCYRLSDYGKKSENDTFSDWQSISHSYNTDKKWFNDLYQYMLSVIDKCKAQGYNAYDEANIASERKEGK